MADELAAAALLDALRLTLIDGVGPRTQQLLLEHFDTIPGIFAASRSQLLNVQGVGPKLASAILAARDSLEPEQELARCQARGISLIPRGSALYPESLSKIPDPPALLYCRGELQPRDALAIAIVGSRRCTVYGRQQAERLGGALARAGLTVISGLARGIDGAAHHGALQAGGRTLAVMGTGLEKIYPPEHADLAERVSKSGALLTEYPLGQAPLPGLFPQRNRIVSGMSLGIIVVEANRNSGAMHTVRHALEQGRDVFAVPGRIDSLASEGCHDLIRDGATLIRNVDDVLQALGPLISPVKTSADTTVNNPRELTLDRQEQEILNLVSPDPTLVDEVLQAAGIEASRVLATLTMLEMKRFIRRLPGNQVCRV